MDGCDVDTLLCWLMTLLLFWWHSGITIVVGRYCDDDFIIVIIDIVIPMLSIISNDYVCSIIDELMCVLLVSIINDVIPTVANWYSH